MVSVYREIFLLCFVSAVLTFFIAGLLFFVPRARGYLGAYSIPSETGLLISSDFDNVRGCFTRSQSQRECLPVR
jgi:hypothetical protein